MEVSVSDDDREVDDLEVDDDEVDDEVLSELTLRRDRLRCTGEAGPADKK